MGRYHTNSAGLIPGSFARVAKAPGSPRNSRCMIVLQLGVAARGLRGDLSRDRTQPVAAVVSAYARLHFAMAEDTRSWIDWDRLGRQLDALSAVCSNERSEYSP